jgi:hypothetical protein
VLKAAPLDLSGGRGKGRRPSTGTRVRSTTHPGSAQAAPRRSGRRSPGGR